MNINDMKILSVFNELDCTKSIAEYLESFSLSVDAFDDAKEALKSSKQKKYDLVILDSSTKKPNDIGFLKEFRHIHPNTPIIFLTEIENTTLQEKALKLGAYDILNKPVSPIVFQAKLEHALRHTKAEALLNDETALLQHELLAASKRLKDNEHELLEILAKSSAYKEHKNSTHTVRVAHYSQILANAAGLSQKVQDIAFHASRVYDIGKVGIPEHLLLKKEKLTDKEYKLIKTHARLGFDLLKYTQGEYLKAAAVISYSHHEKYDGSGYPIGLKGETIPILGRIVAIVDVFDALTSKKPYRDAWSIEEACDLLKKEKSKHFDPIFVDVFLQNIDKIKSIKMKLERS